MKRKRYYKIVVDLLMAILLFVLMPYQLTGQFVHEWTGMLMLVLVLTHHFLNIQWVKNIFKGSYNMLRTIQSIVDGLLILSMLSVMLSGIRLSRYAVPFLPAFMSASLARLIHLAASYWSFVLMSIHLGLHWGMVTQVLRKTTAKQGRYKTVAWILAVGIGIYGAWAFWHHQIWMYLLLRTEFLFFDEMRPAVLIFLDYIAMMGVLILLTYGAVRLWQRKRRKSTYNS